MMATLTVLMGPPGSGKSTWAGTAANVLTSDALHGTGRFDAASVSAFYSDMLAHAAEVLRSGADVVLDTPGIKRQFRERAQQVAAVTGSTARLVVFRTPLDVCLSRQAGRPNVVPAPVVVRLWTEATAQHESVTRERWDSVQFVAGV